MTLASGARGFVLALLVLAASTGAALAAPKFPPLSGRVVDNANVLSPVAERELTEDLAALEAKTGRQVVVATVPDLQGYEIEEYGYQLGRTWQIGRKGEDDGVILLVAPKERKVRIEVGYGLEGVLTDALSSVILQRRVLPEFREGRMERGVVQGAAAIVEQLSLPEDEAKAQVAQAAAQSSREGADGGLTIGAVVTMIVIFFILSSILRALGGGRRGRRGGGNMWWLLPLILSSSGRGGRGGGWGGGGGGFSGGGGSFGGGGSSGSW